MPLSRIYVEDMIEKERKLILAGDTYRYVYRVLRKKIGDRIEVFNGTGYEWSAVVTAVGKQEITIQIKKRQQARGISPLDIHLGQVLSKGDRMDFVIQKATELGVSHITPLFSQYCEVKLDATRQKRKLAHWRKIVISASEQCGRSILPVIHPPQRFSHFIAEVHADLKIIPHQDHDCALASKANPQSLALAIGPEGGFSEEEITQAKNYDFLPILMGPRVLRTETAPIVALTIAQTRWGDF